MATSQIQFRSISLPSRLHPINPTKYELKSWEITSSLSKELPLSSETIQSSLLGLAELYTSVGKLKESPYKQDRKAVEDSLEGSVDLLDFCNTIQELVQMMKENVQSLQSGFRRKGVDSSIQNDITSYFYMRKKMNKSMAKIFKKLKNLENKNTTGTHTSIGSNLSVNGDTIFIRGLREVIGVTAEIFKCVLESFSSPIIKPCKGWLLIAAKLTKSMASARFHHHHHGIIMNEVGSVDFALNSIQERIWNNVGVINVVDLQMVQRKLQNLEFSIQGIEVGLERLFRHLLQCRVTLLNILTDQL